MLAWLNGEEVTTKDHFERNLNCQQLLRILCTFLTLPFSSVQDSFKSHEILSQKSLGPFFVSAHIRAEKMLTFGNTFNNSEVVKKCISNLTTRVQRYQNASRAPIPLFLATDFGDYGSLSRGAVLVRENAKSLMNILAPLKPITFQPSDFNLTDHGAVAIVEMSILLSGKRLFVVGGGSFQAWQASLDENVKCRNELCNTLCCL